MLFVTIGFVEFHKGQDILIDALKKIPDEELKNVEVLLVGNESSLFAQRIKAEIENVSFIKLAGTMDRDGIHELLGRADVLICPSRQDSMPTVCAEAMMHCVPCIVSDSTGTASYITDGTNGFVFESENSEQLKEKIKWCIDNRGDLPAIGEKSRAIYEQFFSQEVFEKKLLGYVEEMIGKN